MQASLVESSDYDVIIVGLGCAGLSTAYWCAKSGLRVLGLERNTSSGQLGSSSFGETRIYRTMHSVAKQTEAMKEAIPLWNKIEEESKT